jgi:nitrogen-specific signal transduction histidine kinase
MQTYIRGSEAIMTESEQERLRSILHELSNVMTGILINGGLLRLALNSDDRKNHADHICEGGERGAELVRQARSLLPTPLEHR